MTTLRINRGKANFCEQRWNNYVTAGAASALFMLMPQQTAEADFSFVELNQTLMDQVPGDGYFGEFGPYTLGASGASFIFQQAFSETRPGAGQMTVIGNGNLSFAGSQRGPNQYFFPSNLPYGQFVSTVMTFGIPAGARGDMAWSGGAQFLEPGLSFVGFRFDLGNGTQYGFAELIMDGFPLNTGTLVGIGWGDVGDQVFAGQRPVVPEPGLMSVLALGSLGLLAWRSRKFSGSMP